MIYGKTTIYSVYCIAFSVLLLAFSCTGSVNDKVDDGGGGGGDPPFECEGFLEIEPNDTEELANYVGLMPHLQPENICGTFFDYEPFDQHLDYYYFFLNPNPGAEHVMLNIALTTDETVVPAIRFLQTVYDDQGNPVDYNNLGIFFGIPGSLVILDFCIPYDFLESNDLYMRVEGIYPPDYIEKKYKLQYWNY